MPIRIDSITLKPELTAGTTDYLLGNITGKVVATIAFRAEWTALAGLITDNQQMIFVAASKTITWSGGNFQTKGFVKGDTFTITGDVTNNGNYIIADIVGNVITIVGATVNDTSETAVLTGTTECKGINFRHNLIENNASANYNSLIDGNELRHSGIIHYTPATPVKLVQQGVYSSNHLDDDPLAIEGVVVTGTTVLNTFVLVHTFYINPFFLLSQLADLGSEISPDYFFNSSCLKYLYKIDLLYDLANPNKIQKGSDNSLLGNTGWLNENFNNGLNKFHQTTIFKQSAVVIDYADYEGITDIEITVTSDNAVFSNNNTKFVLNHFILPESESQYINTSTDFETNFMFDRGLQTVGSAAVNGDKLGTVKQVLTDIEATFVSTSEILVKAKVDLSAAYKARIAALTDKQMILSVYIQDHTKTTLLSDAEACFDGIKVYDTDLSNPTVGTVTTVFNAFPSTAVDFATAGYFVEDTLRGKTIISVDITDGALIQDISVKIQAEKTGASFVLEQKNFSFSGAIVSGGIQQYNFEDSRGFILNSGNDFNIISLKRRADLDAGNNKFYELIYSFKIRWEDFIKISGVHADFYDINELYNGYNQNWNRYFVAAGWSLKYVVTANIIENTYVNAIESSKALYAYDYEEATDFTQTIKIYDIDTSTGIPNDILSDKVVRIEAEFTKTAGTIPALIDIAGIIEYEPYQLGGENVIRNINTIYSHESGSPFVSVLGNSLLKKEKNANVYKFTANIDGRLLTGSPKISSRIYIPVLFNNKQFQDGSTFLFQNKTVYEFQ